MRAENAAPLSPAMELLTGIVQAHAEGITAGYDLQQSRIDALVACCEATLRYLEGPACLEVLDELRAVEGVIAMLRAAVGEARA